MVNVASLLIAISFYFSVPLLSLFSILLIIITYNLSKLPNIVDSKSLARYIKRLNIKPCCNIMFDNNADIYAFFPSKIGNDSFLVSSDHCIIKKNNEVIVYDKYNGIEAIINEFCN